MELSRVDRMLLTPDLLDEAGAFQEGQPFGIPRTGEFHLSLDT